VLRIEMSEYAFTPAQVTLPQDLEVESADIEAPIAISGRRGSSS